MPENKDLDYVYATYSISGEEGNPFATAVVQFHTGRPDGPGMLLEEPAKILLDNQSLTADSAKANGVFYEWRQPADEFAGRHTIRFIDEDKKEHKEEFLFNPVVLAEEVPEYISKKDFILRFEGLPDGQPLRIVMTDTTFEGEGINEVDTVYNNQLDITEYLSGLERGPIMLQLFSEQERKLKDYRGEISITYSLKREFELKD